MALWTSTDGSAGAPKFGQITPAFGSSANGLQLYANTQTGAFVTAQAVGVFGVDTTEQGVAANPKGGHAGWVLMTTGSGGRSGRKHVETLVAMGSMTGDGGAIANDDVTFADA